MPTFYEHDLPRPDGMDLDGVPHWRLSTGDRVYVLAGRVFTGGGEAPLASVEWDAYAHLAAVAWARGHAEQEDTS